MVSSNFINGFEIEIFNQYNLKVGVKNSTCPKCSSDRKPSNQKAKVMMLDWERGIGTCQHCDAKIQLHTFKKKQEKMSRVYKKPEPIKNKELTESALKWFEERCISEDTLSQLKVYSDKEWMPQMKKEVNVICMPFYFNQELVNVKYRDARKNFKMVSDAIRVFYNVDNIEDEETVVITEGEIDAMSFYEIGVKNVISVPNGATLGNNNLDYLDNCIDSFSNKSKVILALDNDEAGNNLRSEFIRRLGAEACYTVDFGEYKDANECLVKEGAKYLHDVLKRCKQVPLENVVTLRDMEGELEEFVKNGFKPGYQIGLEEFDNIFSTYTSQFIAVTGVPSSGKSDFVDQMTTGYNRKYGWKTAYASPENKPNYLHAHKLVRKRWEGMPSSEDIGSDTWKQVTQHVNDNFFFIEMDKYSLDAVLAKGAELVKRKGIKCLVLDPFNKIRDKSAGASGDVNAYTLEYLEKIEVFCKKYDVLVIIVAHPVKMYKDSNGKMAVPDFYSIKGGGEWYDASYHGLCVHRDYENETVMVKVMKVKFQNLGTNGAETHFKWEPDSGIYIPHALTPDDDIPWENS